MVNEVSDHTPMVVTIQYNTRKGRKSFQFLDVAQGVWEYYFSVLESAVIRLRNVLGFH